MLLGETPWRKHRDQETVLAYSKREAAAATSLSVRSLDYLIERGQLRAVKVGRRVLIPCRELERLIEKGTSRAFAEPGGEGIEMHDHKS
jgi:excisionase family DNA binding protein